MLNTKHLIGSLLFLWYGLFMTSCSVQHVTIYCEPHNADIYINGKFQGNGIVDFPIPPHQPYIVVSCSEDNVFLYERQFSTKNLPSVINIYLDEYKKYSSESSMLKTH